MPSYEPDNSEARGRRDLLVPLAFLVLSGLLLGLPMPVQQQVSAGLRSSVLAPFIWTQESLRETRVRVVEVSDLQARLDSTLAVLFSQQYLEEENRQLRALLGLRGRDVPGFVPASALRPGTRGSESMFLLDVGEVDGVQVNDPVVVADGLIGVVREVGPGTALAMDWTHPDFRVSVMTRDGAAFGIVGPRLGVFREEARLVLGSVPYHTPVQTGSLVVTSGQGGIYPRGVPVGTILGLAESEAGWQRSYWLEPAVFPGSVTHVLVMTEQALGSVEELEHLWRWLGGPADSLDLRGWPGGGLGPEGVGGGEGAEVEGVGGPEEVSGRSGSGGSLPALEASPRDGGRVGVVDSQGEAAIGRGDKVT